MNWHSLPSFSDVFKQKPSKYGTKFCQVCHKHSRRWKSSCYAISAMTVSAAAKNKIPNFENKKIFILLIILKKTFLALYIN